MKRILLLSLFAAAFSSANAQKYDYFWAFMDSMGLDFRTDPPTVIATACADTSIMNSSLTSRETMASVADENGHPKLLLRGLPVRFYNISPPPNPLIEETEVGEVRNAGGDILANDVWVHNSLANGAVFVKSPDSDYWLFTVKGEVTSPVSLYGLFAHRMTEFGIVEKNRMLIEAKLAEKVAAISHAKGKDWWIIAHLAGVDTFVTFLLSGNEIQGPFFQKTGSIYSPYTSWTEYGVGETAVSPDGTRFCSVVRTGVIDLFRFDRCTGKLYDYRRLGHDFSSGLPAPIETQGYGCAFSPDGSKLYLTLYNHYPRKLFQYDLNDNASRTLIWTYDGPMYVVYGPSQMQTAPDGKIYVTNYCNCTGTLPGDHNPPYSDHLGVIENPNAAGLACNFQPASLYMGGKMVYAGLPNMPVYAPQLYSSPASIEGNFTLCPDSPPVLLGRENNVDASHYHPIYEWAPCVGLSCCDCERPLAFPEITTQYTLRVVVEGGCEFIDSVTVAVENVALPTLQDTSVCAGTSFVLPWGSGVYSWSPAVVETETSFVFTPLETTTYTLSYSEMGNCFAVDSFRITVIPRYVSVGGFEASYPDTFASPPFSVRFSSLTSGADSSLFVWYFGDSTSAIGLGNPVHVYPDTGSYVVSFVMLPPPGYCGSSVYSDTIRLVMRDTTNTTDTTSRTPPLLEGGQGGGVRVYPNPAQDEVRIYSERMNCLLSLYDGTGKQILGDVQVFAGVETKISTKHLPEGVYFVKFRGGLRTGYVALVVAR